MIKIPVGVKMMPLTIEQRYKPSFCTIATIEEEGDETPWYQDILNFIKKGEYPKETIEKDKRPIRKFFAQFIICSRKLLKKGYNGHNVICLYENAARRRMMEEIHEGVSGPHINGHMLAKKIIRQGYYWTILEKIVVNM